MGTIPESASITGMTKDEQELRDRLALLSESEKIDLIIELMTRIGQLTARMTVIEARIGMNSANSSKPPSSDGYAKPNPKSLRKSSGRKPGGKKGHSGTTLCRVAEPDEIVVHEPGRCVCGCGLDDATVEQVESRQVFDLPEKLVWVTEHRMVSKTCPHCGCTVRAVAPPQAPGPVQYGPRIRAMVVYLRDVLMLPYQRLTDFCDDVLGVGICTRSVETTQKQVYETLTSFEQMIRAQLLNATTLNADETGLRVNGKLHWLHSLSTATLTLYQMHPRRGGEAIEANGIIPAFHGVLLHDCWSPYFRYGDAHALCGAHLLRELAGICENEGHRWAQELSCLLEMIPQTDAASDASSLTPELAGWFEQTYNEILARGTYELAPPRKTPGKRGRAKNSKSANLHKRLVIHRDAVLRCLRNPLVPFTNNQAERDIRMAKLRQKISGGERTFTGAQIFARIRSYVSTSRKQGKNLFQNIVDAVNGYPWIPLPLLPPA
jgi:transposase